MCVCCFVCVCLSSNGWGSIQAQRAAPRCDVCVVPPGHTVLSGLCSLATKTSVQQIYILHTRLGFRLWDERRRRFRLWHRVGLKRRWTWRCWRPLLSAVTGLWHAFIYKNVVLKKGLRCPKLDFLLKNLKVSFQNLIFFILFDRNFNSKFN